MNSAILRLVLSVTTVCVVVAMAFVYVDITKPRRAEIGSIQANGDMCQRKLQPKLVQGYPQAIIAGFPKAGTSALLTYLALHPDIEASDGEVKFFNLDRNYELGYDWYRQQMPFRLPDQICIEKSPNTITSPSCFPRILAFNESIRIIVIVRDPVVRAISHFVHNHQRSTRGQIKSSRKAAELFEAGVFQNFQANEVNPLVSYLQKSTYITYLKRIYEIFRREQIFIVNGDMLIKNPASVLRRLETFLGVKHALSHQNFYFDQAKGFFCPVDFCGRRLCLNENKGRRHPVIREEVKQKLREHFRPYNKALFELIQEDFGWTS